MTFRSTHIVGGETPDLAGSGEVSPFAASPGEAWISLGDALASVVEKAAIQRLRVIGEALASGRSCQPAP